MERKKINQKVIAEVIVGALLIFLFYYFGYKFGTKLSNNNTKETTTKIIEPKSDINEVISVLPSNQSSYSKSYQVVLNGGVGKLTVSNIASNNTNSENKSYSLKVLYNNKEIYNEICSERQTNCLNNLIGLSVYNKMYLVLYIANKFNDSELKTETAKFFDDIGENGGSVDSYLLSDGITFKGTEINYYANELGEITSSTDTINIYKFKTIFNGTPVKEELYGKVDYRTGKLLNQ
jgi:hypothetical protein